MSEHKPMTKSDALVIAYAQQTTIIREARAFIKCEMQKLSEDEEFCENRYRRYEDSAEESCIRRHIDGYLEGEMCDSCKILWPHVEAKFNAKKERSKIMQKINALGNRLAKEQSNGK